MMEWITTYGNMVFFVGQVVFWLVICVSAVWATLIFRRLTNARIAFWAGEEVVSKPKTALATPASGSGEFDKPAADTAEKPAIDEFVD